MTQTRFASYVLSSLFIGCLAVPAILSADTPPTVNTQSRTLVLDVALDGRTLSYSRPDAVTSGPQRGDAYVLNGYVYSSFSIPDGDTTSTFAPDPDASIGTIVISGIMLSDPATAASGDAPAVTTTHTFSLSNADGMVTQGLEGAGPQIRALLGGMGQYSGAVGQVTEQLLGTNGTGGPNLRFTFQLIQLNPQDNSASPMAQRQRVRNPRRNR